MYVCVCVCDCVPVRAHACMFNGLPRSMAGAPPWRMNSAAACKPRLRRHEQAGGSRLGPMYNRIEIDRQTRSSSRHIQHPAKKRRGQARRLIASVKTSASASGCAYVLCCVRVLCFVKSAKRHRRGVVAKRQRNGVCVCVCLCVPMQVHVQGCSVRLVPLCFVLSSGLLSGSHEMAACLV